MDLGIASPVNAVHMDTVSAGGGRTYDAMGPTVVLVAASVATRVKVRYEGTMVLVAYVPASETSRVLLAAAEGRYSIEVNNRDSHSAADIYVTLEAVAGPKAEPKWTDVATGCGYWLGNPDGQWYGCVIPDAEHDHRDHVLMRGHP